MIYKNRIITLMAILLLMSVGWGEDCEEGYIWLEHPSSWDGPDEWISSMIDTTNCFYQNHISIIQNLIESNSESLNLSMDSNYDGVIEPLEFGGFGSYFMGDFHNPGTQWSDGKLVSLFCEGNCGLSYLPENICDIINIAPFEWGMWSPGFIFNDNNICPPIPTCIESYASDPDLVNIDFGFQNCLDCQTFGSDYTYIDFNIIDGINLPNDVIFRHSSNTNCYKESDIEFINDIISINSSNSIFGYYSNFGSCPTQDSYLSSLNNIHPLQLGRQNWVNGRLKGIELGHTLQQPNSVSLGISLIPETLINLDELEKLNLSCNYIEVFPDELFELINLEYLNINKNQLTGEIPSEIGNLTNLEFLNLQSNQLTGEIPENICYLSNLLPWGNSYSSSPLHNNQLCPPYPDCLVNQEPFEDLNGNGIWDEGEPFEDLNGNGHFEEDYVGTQDTSECVEYQLGDVDMDGLLDILDIVLGINILVDIVEYTDEQYELLDYNQDGECNILDLVRIIGYILSN